MMLRPLWKNLVRLCSPVTRHHGTGRSCARELLSDIRSPLLHRMNQTTIKLNEIKRPRILVTSMGILPYSMLFPRKITSVLRSTV